MKPFMKQTLTAGLACLVMLLAAASLAIGPAPLSPLTAAKALFVDLGSASIVVREIRLPRTVLAILIGWIFGLSGAALQGLECFCAVCSHLR